MERNKQYPIQKRILELLKCRETEHNQSDNLGIMPNKRPNQRNDKSKTEASPQQLDNSFCKKETCTEIFSNNIERPPFSINPDKNYIEEIFTLNQDSIPEADFPNEQHVWNMLEKLSNPSTDSNLLHQKDNFLPNKDQSLKNIDKLLTKSVVQEKMKDNMGVVMNNHKSNYKGAPTETPVKRKVMFAKTPCGAKKVSANNILVNVIVHNQDVDHIDKRETDTPYSNGIQETSRTVESLKGFGNRKVIRNENPETKSAKNLLIKYKPLEMYSHSDYEDTALIPASDVEESFSETSSEFSHFSGSSSATLFSCLSQDVNIETNSETSTNVVHMQKSKTVIHSKQQKAGGSRNLKLRNRKHAPQLIKPPHFHQMTIHTIEPGFENMTSCNVPHEVKVILSLGYAFTPLSMPSLRNYIATFQNNSNRRGCPTQGPGEACFYLDYYLKHSYTEMHDALKKQKMAENEGLINALAKTILFLQKNTNNLCILHRHNSYGLVLVECQAYTEKLDAWVENCTKLGIFQETSDPDDVEKWQKVCHRKYQRYYHDLQDANGISSHLRETLDDLNKPNLCLPFLHAVIKQQFNEGHHLLPVVTVMRWYSYGLKRVIKNALTRVLTKQFFVKYSVTSCTKLSRDIRTTNVMEGFSFVKLIPSEDIFISVNTIDVIHAVSRVVYSKGFKKDNTIDPDLLMNMLECYLHTMMVFMYRGKMYRQVKGLPPGGCGAQLLFALTLDYKLQLHDAEIFPDGWVAKRFKYKNQMLFYMRTDCVAALIERLEKYTAIKFSVESENYDGQVQHVYARNVVSFCEIDIVEKRSGRYGKFLTKIYRNQNVQHSNTMTHALNNVPDNWKSAIIYLNLRRILQCVSNEFLSKELYFLEQHFCDNLYPVVAIRIIKYCICQLTHLKPDSPFTTKDFAVGNINNRVSILSSYMKSLELIHPNLK